MTSPRNDTLKERLLVAQTTDLEAGGTTIDADAADDDSLSIKNRQSSIVQQSWFRFATVFATSAVTYGVAYGFGWMFENTACDFMFACGCVLPPPFGAGWDECNVHNLSGPRCPFCAAPDSYNWTPMFIPPLCVAIVHASLYLRRFKKQINIAPNTFFKQTGRQALIALVMMPAVWFLSLIVIGFLFFISSPYPYFLVSSNKSVFLF